MPQLFKCETIAQFKIHRFLANEGLSPDAIASVCFPDGNSVRITDHLRNQMIVTKKAGNTYAIEYLIDGIRSTETREEASS